MTLRNKFEVHPLIMLRSRTYQKKDLLGLAVVAMFLFATVFLFWREHYSGDFNLYGRLLSSSGDKLSGETVLYDYEYYKSPFTKGVTRTANDSMITDKNGFFHIYVAEKYIAFVAVEVLGATKRYPRYNAIFIPEKNWSQGSEGSPVTIYLGGNKSIESELPPIN